jgi:hypothetical protein
LHQAGERNGVSCLIFGHFVPADMEYLCGRKLGVIESCSTAQADQLTAKASGHKITTKGQPSALCASPPSVIQAGRECRAARRAELG